MTNASYYPGYISRIETFPVFVDGMFEGWAVVQILIKGGFGAAVNLS